MTQRYSVYLEDEHTVVTDVVAAADYDALAARLAEAKQLLDTAHALIFLAVASRNNGGMTTTPTHDEMRAWLLAYADRATNSASVAQEIKA